ncbi:MAG: aromatic acid exporter family protein [Erysipelotrichaceae bacterium]|nr:aromatic acid exporter family protein [Erysipelotrichaceae bacterium]
MFKRIGLRTIKTGIAVTLSLWVSMLLRLEYPFFVAMTAIISMDKTAMNSMKMGKNRIAGTFIGAIVGILLSYIDRGNPILCGLGIILMIVICNSLKLKGSISIGGIVLLAIMVHTDKTPLFYGFNRTLDTIIGAGIALLVNCTIFPYYNVRRLDDIVIKMWEQSDSIIQALENREPCNLTEIHQNMKEIENELGLYETEILFHKKKELVAKLRRHYEMTKRLLFEMDVCQSIDQQQYKEVYEFHVKRVHQLYLDYIDDLQAKYVQS